MLTKISYISLTIAFLSLGLFYYLIITGHKDVTTLVLLSLASIGGAALNYKIVCIKTNHNIKKIEALYKERIEKK